MATAKAVYYLRIRTYDPPGDIPWADVWLLRVSGPAESCQLHGRVTPQDADALSLLFRTKGVRVVREQRKVATA